jgi:hypothetical protein
MQFARTSIALGLAGALLAACGEETNTTPSTVHQRPAKGYSVTVPDGWHRAEHNLTAQITDPIEMLSLATAPFRRGEGLCEALARVVPEGGLVAVQERGAGAHDSPDFPARPAHFRPKRVDEGYSTWPHCGVQDGEPPIPMDHYWFGFSDAGRAFHVLVAFGKEASEQVREEAFAALDSLRLDPEVTPDWPSAESYVYGDRKLGFSATIPAGWRRAKEPVDELTTNPRELLVLSTFELPRFAKASDGCGPFYDHVLDHMPDDEALLAIRERLGSDVAGPPEFPRRPDVFELEPIEPEAGGCPDGRRRFRRWWIPFEAAGRDFYAQVDIGVDAPYSLRDHAARVLNNFSPTERRAD